MVEPGDFILSNSMSFGRPYILKTTGCIHDGWLVFKQKAENISKDFIYSILTSDKVKAQFEKAASGGVVRNLNINLVKEVKIPIPPLSIQEEIVAEIEGYQKIIDGARMVVENYRPQIKIDPEWEMKGIGEVAKVNPKKSEIRELDPSTEVSFVPMADLGEHRMSFISQETRKLEEVYKGYTYFRDNDVLVAKVTPCFENGKAGIAKNLTNGIGFWFQRIYRDKSWR